MDIKKIHFGVIDAKQESKQYPELLNTGYWDGDSVVEKALNERTFLFLGYKGSGKSALAEHLKITKSSFDCNVIIRLLNSFHYNQFAKFTGAKNEDRIQEMEFSWAWVLLVDIFQNILSDEGAKTSEETAVNQLADILRKNGILPAENLNDVLSASVKRTFKFNLPNIFQPLSDSPLFGYEVEKTQNNRIQDIESICKFVLKLLLSFTLSQKQILIIDGIDDVLSDSDVQYDTVTALIRKCSEINETFQNAQIPIKILVLCRTDIFDRLKDPNKNKMNDGRIYHFSWYSEGSDCKDSGLVKIANIRTKIVYNTAIDVFDSLFPPKFNSKPIREALLEYTRHTPRDFTQLLNSIQQECKGNHVVDEAIKKGIANYSTNYFIGEIRDELTGYLTPDEIEGIITLFSSMRKVTFSLAELKMKEPEQYGIENSRLMPILKTMYNCCAIGNEYTEKNGKHRFSFKFRNRTSNFAPAENIRVHKGLWKVLNLAAN